MKKFLKLSLIVMVCFLLVGCGKDKADEDKKGAKDDKETVDKDASTYQEKGYTNLKDTLVSYSDATKEIYDLKMTVYFKDGKAANAKVVLTFQERFKYMIENMKETLSQNSSYKDVTISGNTLTYDYTKEGFATFDKMTKEEVKAELEKSEYRFK